MTTVRRGAIKAGFRIQAKVIFALMMRELHTKFGRRNLGYLWAFIEPANLAIGITALHMIDNRTGYFPMGFDAVTFAVTGYTPWVMFRSMINSSGMAILSNQTLLYHRRVTLPDILLSRAALDIALVMTVMFILQFFLWSLGQARLPDRPLEYLMGLGVMAWMGAGMSMIVAAGAEWSETFERFVHPAMYLMMAVAGVFLMPAWLPEPYATWLSYFPTQQAYEIIREGQWGFYTSHYIHPLYAMFLCLGSTSLGLLTLRITRRHMVLQ